MPLPPMQGVYELLAHKQHQAPEPCGLQVMIHGTVPLGELPRPPCPQHTRLATTLASNSNNSCIMLASACHPPVPCCSH